MIASAAKGRNCIVSTETTTLWFLSSDNRGVSHSQTGLRRRRAAVFSDAHKGGPVLCVRGCHAQQSRRGGGGLWSTWPYWALTFQMLFFGPLTFGSGVQRITDLWPSKPRLILKACACRRPWDDSLLRPHTCSSSTPRGAGSGALQKKAALLIGTWAVGSCRAR